MKKILYTSCILLGLTLFSTLNLFAQDGLQLEAGAAYGSEVEAIGIQAGAKYNFTNKLAGTADLIFFFPDHYDWWEININGNYDLFSDDIINVYGLAGLNYATIKVDLGQYGSASDSELGLNLGGGAEFAAGFGNIYTELKYVVGNSDQLAVSAGVRFTIQ